MRLEWDEMKNQLNRKKHRDQRPTEEQIRCIREAAKREIVFDEDSPEMTPGMEEAFRIAARKRNINRKMDVS